MAAAMFHEWRWLSPVAATVELVRSAQVHDAGRRVLPADSVTTVSLLPKGPTKAITMANQLHLSRFTAVRLREAHVEIQRRLTNAHLLFDNIVSRTYFRGSKLQLNDGIPAALIPTFPSDRCRGRGSVPRAYAKQPAS